MEFAETAPKNKQSQPHELVKVSSSRLNETPFGDDLISNDTDHGNAAIDLSGDSNQMPSECDSNFEGKSGAAGHDIFEDLN